MPYSELYRRILYKMGYYSYQEGLIYRHLKQKGGWDSHLSNCRSFILKAADLLKPRKVTVLGSGWLLDFPLAEMLERDIEIILIDIVHPPEVKKQLEGIERVRIAEADLTGGLIAEIWEKAGRLPFYKKLRSTGIINIPEYRPEDEDPGMVVSLNLLSQLDILPVRLLRKKSSVPEDELLNFRKEVQQKHLAFLLKHRSVLITDVREIYSDRKGQSIEEQTVVITLPPAEVKEEWTWNFDSTFSDYYGKKSVLEVVAMVL